VSGATTGNKSVSVYAQYAQVSGISCKSANAATVTTYVSALPSISSHTAATSTCSGSTALLRVTASNATAYQWKKDGQDVTDGTGGTSASYTTGALTAEATYTVVVSNAAGCSVTSSSIPVTVIAPPDITLSGANVQTVDYCEPITTIEYSAANSTFALSGGSLPAGVTGTASEGSFTIAGMPSGAAAGVYNYTVTATSSSVGACTATASGTITLNETVPAPSGARTARVWCIGTQLWSDAIALAPAGCTAASTNFGTASPPTTAYYRSSGLVTGSGYLYNWKCVDEQATTLCPSPWSVPVSTDFCKLDQAYGYQVRCVK
jgi:hypothetical protein